MPLTPIHDFGITVDVIKSQMGKLTLILLRAITHNYAIIWLAWLDLLAVFLVALMH